MKQTITVAFVASVLLGIALVPVAEAAEPQDETPQEKITRLKREAAQLRMQLNHARASAQKAKAAQADADLKAKQADAAQAAFEKQIADLKTTVKTLTAQNAKLQGLLDTDAKTAADKKVSDALTQLVDALKKVTELQAGKEKLATENKTLKAQTERSTKLTATTRRELAVATASLRDVRQELAIEKGKRIAPATATKPPPKRTDGTKPPKAEPKIATRVRAVSGELASIEVGSTAGVTVGMKLLVSRGADYVATLVISQVEKRQAAGELIDVRSPARAGDSVSNMP